MIAINNEYKAGIGLAAFIIARFDQLDRDCGYQQSAYRFDRCWDISASNDFQEFTGKRDDDSP